MRLPRRRTLDELLDRPGLVARRLELGVDLEGGHGPMIRPLADRLARATLPGVTDQERGLLTRLA